MSQITTNPIAPPEVPPEGKLPEAKAPDAAPAAAPQVQKQPLTRWEYVKKRILWPVASLRVTVVLFALSLFLVFAGTLAQAETGNMTVIHQYFRAYGIVWIPWQVFIKFGQVFIGLDAELRVAGSFPFPGGWLLGGLLLLNLLTAHALRFRATWRDLFLLPLFVGSLVLFILAETERSSLVLMVGGTLAMALLVGGFFLLHARRGAVLTLHAGLIVMMLSELVTGLYAVEGTMTLVEGERASFVDKAHEVELAVINRSNPKVDDVVAIPESIVRRGGKNPHKIEHALLPFDIVVERYMTNSSVPARPVDKDEKRNPANAGDGLNWVVHERPEVSGADTDQGMDVAAAYITLYKKGTTQKIDKDATYLVTQWFYSNFTRRQLPDLPQKVTVGNTEYHLYLRSKRTYRPYAIELLEFRHDRFQGVAVAKNFSSVVRLTDPTEGEDREVKIWMNHPLRYQGETFYQSGFLQGDGGTILQVVRNPGWLMPYISCVMVSVGMLVHFGLHLAGFLRRRAAV